MAVSPRLHYSLRALGGRMGEQWERDRRDTLFLMGATLLAASPHFLYRPWWASAGFLVLFFWRLGLVLSGRWLPRDSVRWVAAIACTAAVYAHYDTLLGRDAGVTLLMLFLGLKLMEMRVRRDLFVVLFLCFFLLMTAFFHSQSMLVAALSLVAVLVLVATMVTMQFGPREAPLARRFRTAAILIVQAIPIAAALFVLFPRLHEPLWGLPEDAHAGSTGLSDSMTPGNIAKLSASDEVAFRVRFNGEVPAEARMYWRGPVLSDFDGQTWKPLAQPAAPLPPAQIRFREDASRTRYALTLEPNNQRWLFALEAPTRLEGLGDAYPSVAPDMQLFARDPIVRRIRYEVESRLDYALGLNETPDSLRNWLALPTGFNPKTLALARGWQAEGTDAAGLVARALALFREQPFRYTMTPPLTGRDGVDDFLFDTRAGFCEHYAGAFVVLMRALGVPSRIVTGYQGGEINPVDDYWIVRQADAHAWAEVWIAGRGWVRVDPVTAVAPERIERGSRALRGSARDEALAGLSGLARTWKLNLDALANSWNQWVLSYDGNRQQRLMAKLGLGFEDWRDMAGLLAATLTVLIGIAALITLHPRVPKDPIERWYREFCDRLAAVGMSRARHETAGRYVERISPGLDDTQVRQAREIVSLYNNLRYAARAFDARAVQNLRDRVQAFKP
jgi:transglutaminase-like putative cysteine protease